MATNVLSIPKEFYVSIQNYIIDTFREGYPAGLIPVENLDNEPYTHRIPYFEDVDVSKGIIDWDAEQKRADKILSYLDVAIHGKQLKLAWTSKDMRAQGAAIINAKMVSIVNKFLDEVDEAIFKGNIEGNVTLGTGLLAQATTVEDLDGTDSALVGAAGLLAGVKKMITSLPVKYRKQPIVMVMDWHLYDILATTFIGTDTATSVLAVFKNAYPMVHIEKNNSAVLTSGTDTAGTHFRILVFPQDINLLRIVKAKEVSPVGPALVTLTGGIEQLWGTLFAVKVIEATAVLYSEQITYSAS